jgi:hypothetical protein
MLTRALTAILILLLAACENPDSSGNTGSDGGPIITVPPEVSVTECENNPPSDAIGRFQCSWVYRALSLQRQLNLALPLREAQIFSSHNSYNSSAYPGLSTSDLNQTRSLVEQFQLGVRSFELDVHWIFHAASAGFAPVTCHGLGAGQEHLGCTAADRHLNETLDEIVAFLASEQGRGQLLFLDLENHLSPAPLSGIGTSTEVAHAETLEAIVNKLGDFIYQPSGNGGCQSMPMDISQNEILATDKRIVLNAPCSQAGWENWAFDVGSVRQGQKAHTGFSGYPDCDSGDFAFDDYRQRWIREWEDTTLVGAATNSSLQRMSAQHLQDMAHCGVNLISLDRIDPEPPQVGVGNPSYVGQGVDFEALVWSWATGKPALNNELNCAYLDLSDGRFHDGLCSDQRAYACLRDDALQAPVASTNDLWRIQADGDFESANCPAGYHFARPGNGWFKQQLVETLSTTSDSSVWVNYHETAVNRWN